MRNNLLNSISDTITDLKDMQETLEHFELKLSSLSQIIAYIFDQIKTSNTSQETQNYFDILDKIHIQLSQLLFKYNIKMPFRLERFVRDFDNFEEAKSIYLEQIKTGEYTF